MIGVITLGEVYLSNKDNIYTDQTEIGEEPFPTPHELVIYYTLLQYDIEDGAELLRIASEEWDANNPADLKKAISSLWEAKYIDEY